MGWITSRTLRIKYDEFGARTRSATVSQRERASARNGFALLIVLLWLAFLALLATQITLSGRTDTTVAANALGSAHAESATDGAIYHALFELLTRQWPANGSVHLLPADRTTVRVRIDNEAEKLDPNVAPSVLLRALLQTCGATVEGAARIANAIVEWRSIDLLQTAAETATQYKSDGLSYAPPHARFVSSDELGLVAGMTPRLLACLNPHMSIYSLSVPTLQTTSDPVIRQAIRDAYPGDETLSPPDSGQQVAVVRIAALAREIHGAVSRRTAIVRVAPSTPGEHFVYKILSWDDGGD